MDDWLREITKAREIDHEFRKRIENDKVFTCEKHVDVEDFEVCKYSYDIQKKLKALACHMVLFIYHLCEIFLNVNFHISHLCFTLFSNAVQTTKMMKKKPRFGAVPRLNMPKKSHESAKPTPRPARSVVKEHDHQPKANYKSLGELCQRITGLKTLKGWKFNTLSDRLILKMTVEPFLLPEVEIMIDDSLACTVKAFVFFLPEDHPLYVTHWHSVRNLSECEIVRELECYKLCCGVEVNELTRQLFHHVTPINEVLFE